MKISDMLGQYSQNVRNGAEELQSARGMQKMVSSVGELEVGNIFEGTVNSVRGGKVLLALGNGQMVLAQMDGRVNITPGSSMFFQVKSNDGETVAIRPYTGAGNTGNPILLNALTTAGLPATERNFVMVDSMMKEQMSVGKQSLLEMVRVLNANPDVKVPTLVQMTKMGIPINAQTAAQFENYLTDSHTIFSQMDDAINQITGVFENEEMTGEAAFAVNEKILDILEQENPRAVVLLEEMQGETQKAAAASEQQGGAAGAEPIPLNGEAAGKVPEQQMDASVKEAVQTLAEGRVPLSGEPLSSLFSEEQLAHLTKILQSVPALATDTQLFPGLTPDETFVDTMSPEEQSFMGTKEAPLPEEASKAVLNKDMNVGEFLTAVRNALEENSIYGFAGVKRLFSSKEYQTALRSVMEQQWLIKPEELRQEHKVSELYDRLEAQMNQMEHVIRAAGAEAQSFHTAAADVQSNIEFMNQVNQVYNYVQIPLRLSGQNASSELYVYRNRRNQSDPDGELTAFLHLDLEHLGSTDVSIKLREKNVTANFYLDDDASYELVEKHLPILEKHLKKKGYFCKVTVAKEPVESANFVENIREKENSAAATLHRYSFDVKA
uniref:flagellar hook-length control protein FliK n=1 Tax=Roseburia sp. TaxID=2049040 RepID=UPI003FF05E02